MQASPNLNFDSEHNFDSDTVLLTDECRRVIKTNFRGGPAQRWARTTIAAGHVLKWLKRVHKRHDLLCGQMDGKAQPRAHGMGL